MPTGILSHYMTHLAFAYLSKSGLYCQLPALYKVWLLVLCMDERRIAEYGLGTSIKVAFFLLFGDTNRFMLDTNCNETVGFPGEVDLIVKYPSVLYSA